MRLKKITLNNFRCFEHLELLLHPRLTVLIGENGAGKTALLDGIASVLSPVLTYLSSANPRLSGRGIQDGDFRVVQRPQFGGKARWGMAETTLLQAETADGLTWDVWRASTAGKKPIGVVGQTSLKHHLHGISESYVTEHPRLTPVIAYYGVMRGHIEVPQRLRPARENYGYPTAALIGALDSRSDFREMLAWFDQEEAAELRANKGVIDEDFVESPRIVAVREAIEELLGGAYANPHFNRDHKFVLERKSDGAYLTVNQLSQGYQSMLALGMDFARRLALANRHMDYATPEFLTNALNELAATDWFLENPDHHLSRSAPLLAPSIMLIDEVDLHLHPSWQQRVLRDLMRAFPNTQFIVTTHSPQVLSTVRRENIRVLGPDSSGNLIATEPLAHTYGEPSGDVMQSVMLVDPQPPVAEKADLQRLTEWVDQGRYQDDAALRLMNQLTQALGEQHPQLQRLRRSIQRQEALRQ